MTRNMKRADVILACSEKDAAIIRTLAGHRNVHCVPNAVDTAFYVPGRRQDYAPRVLFPGSLAYPPNVRAVVDLVQVILPEIQRHVPGAVVDIVGKDPVPRVERLASGHVRVIRNVPDIRPYFHRAGVCAVPLRSGGGTRFKILQSLAMGVPVVTTAVGGEGLELAEGPCYRVKDDPVEFARQVADVLASPPSACARLRAREEVARRYSLDAVFEAVSRAFPA